MLQVKFLCILLYILSGPIIRGQLDGGLLGILKPEGSQISVPGLLGLGGKKTSTTTSTSTTTTTAAPATTLKTKKPTEVPCSFTPTFVNGKRSCGGKLIFQDNFSKIANNKWLKEIRFAVGPDYEFTIYEDNEENLYLAKNNLHIRPTLTNDKYGEEYATGEDELNLGDACTGEPTTFECVQKPRAWQILPPTISGLLTTRHHFSFLYGVVEIRARLPQGDWIYPQLYLRPKSNFYGSGYESGLIRIAFTPGNVNMSKILTGGVIVGESDFGRTYGIKSIDSHVRWNRDFHVFKVEWRPEIIHFSVDDEVYASIEPPESGFAGLEELELEPHLIEKWQKGTKLAPFDKEMYLALGVGVGGQVFLDDGNTIKPWENNNPKGPLQFYRQKSTWHNTWGDARDLIVDYVKVWAL